jgi:glutathione S-transferase
MITLYQYATSPFCEKIRRALDYKGLEYEIHEVPRGKLDEYARVSPAGKFPAIEHDGRPVFDSTDIVEYLDATFPERPLIPVDPAARALAHVIEDWADESLYFYEMTMRLAWEHNCAKKVIHEFCATMPGLTAEQALPMVSGAVQAKVAEQGLGKKPRENVVKDAQRHFTAIDGLLATRDWLAGDELSIADLAVAVQVGALLYAEEVVPMVDVLARVKAWIERVDAAAPDRQQRPAGVAS